MYSFQDYIFHLTTVFIRLVATQCNINNGGCSRLCLLSSTSSKNYTCRCPNGMLLRSDGKSCAHTQEPNSTTPQSPIQTTSTRSPERNSTSRKTRPPSKTRAKTTTGNNGMEYFIRPLQIVLVSF